ncbi:MAG TPA: hypothetical protein VFD56_12570, partial [Chitinophagaceae bacterium]|nr:hypothetical protein [Chitinophagaceae bacterium]
MKNFSFLFFFVFLFSIETGAQLSRYIVQLKHKGATVYSLANPSPYLSQRAIDRRARYNISVDSTDLPVPS